PHLRRRGASQPTPRRRERDPSYYSDTLPPMSLPELSIKRPVTTLMILLSVMVVGGIAMARLPLAFLPNVDIPFIGITIPYPNPNPPQTEKQIPKPVEEVLATIPGVKRLGSTSTADSAEFQLEFKWGQNLDIVRMQVGEKVDQV